MSLFNHFHRKPLLSQFLLGILAIFSLPEIQPYPESEQTILNQPLVQAITEETKQEQHLFLAELNLKALQMQCKRSKSPYFLQKLSILMVI